MCRLAARKRGSFGTERSPERARRIRAAFDPNPSLRTLNAADTISGAVLHLAIGVFVRSLNLAPQFRPM